MANIPGNASYMNDLEISSDAPVTEDLWTKTGANINYLLDRAQLGVTEFTSNDSYTTPEGIERVYIVGCGGGGGGGGGGFSGGNGLRRWRGFGRGSRKHHAGRN